MFTAIDHEFMGRALQLAEKGRCTTRPNPAVGCVIVRDGSIIAEGWHERAGGPHAEIVALANAQGDCQGATAYVTLEPCCHEGKTPPCTTALLQAGVSRVVAAMQDPNPLVAGKGLSLLQLAGVETASGLMQAQAEQLNRGFVQRMGHGRPFVTAKLAMSLDGRTAMASGESQWITSPAARQDVQALRRCNCAVMTGIGTVIQDDPQLTLRDENGGMANRQPMRVIVDSHLQTPAHARVLQGDGEKLIFTSSAGIESDRFASCHGLEIVSVPGVDGRVDLPKALQALAQREVNSVLLECGPTLAGGMLQAGLVDELVVYLAPKLMGHEARALFGLTGLEKMQDSINITLHDVRNVGNDLRITAGIER